jgi:hypothetical protein
MPRPRAIVTVDEQLLWLVDLRETPVGTSLPASPASLAALGIPFDAGRRVVRDDVTLGVAGAVTAAVLEWLREPPELPFVGEPFGGVEGTD